MQLSTAFPVIHDSLPRLLLVLITLYHDTCRLTSNEANRIDDIIVEIHNAGLELVTIHDRPEGSFLGSYNYIVEVESESGVSGQTLEKLSAISELKYLGSFQVVEK